MSSIELTKAAFEALEREARKQLEVAVDDRPVGGPLETLGACADILSASSLAQSGWSLQDPREEDAVRSVAFSPAALELMATVRRQTAEHIEELDTSGEGDHDYQAGEVYLLHVLDRVLSAHAEAVTA